MGVFRDPGLLLLAAVLISTASWLLFDGQRLANRGAVQQQDEHLPRVEWTLQRRTRRQLRWSYENVSLDDSSQRQALLALYIATNGPGWKVANVSFSGAVPWGTEGISYCRWYGVTCCGSSPLTMVDCDGLHSVVILSLDGYGLVGSLPAAIGGLLELTVAGLANNPQLVGGLPPSLLALPHLLWLSVEDTALTACAEATLAPSSGGSLPPAVTGPCSLPSSLSFTDVRVNPYGSGELVCPAVIMMSFVNYASDVAPDLWDLLTSPFPTPPVPGAVIAGANFTRYHNCSCRDAGAQLVVQDSGAVGATCVSGGDGGSKLTGEAVMAVALAAVLPWVLIAAVVYICVAHKATLNRLVRRKEAEMARKRSKVPGTPGVALQNGRGVLSLSDVMVTWVVTDVAASTQLWEWKPDVMDRAIDLHNAALRRLMDEFGGHEIRNEGDSFTLSFHDAVDAVTFCLKAQEKLMTVDWPKELAEHPRTNVVSVGDVTSNPEAACKGPPLIAGLRVRMGINTGVPDDIFLHDMTDHVDYRGLEYDLAGEICDLAEGGQVLMGPRTLQRWNKVNYAALIDPLTADLLREQQGGSFLQVSGQPPALMHGPSGRRGSLTGFGGGGGGSGAANGLVSLARESLQQLQPYYSGTLGMAVGGGGTTGGLSYAMSTLATMRRNSDSQPQNSGAVQNFARLSDGDDVLDDEGASSAPPTNAMVSTPGTQVLRAHRSSSPSRILRSPAPARADAHSSDGTSSNPGTGVKPAGTGSPHMAKTRSKLGSPRAMQTSGLSCNDGIPHRARAVTTTSVMGASAFASGGMQKAEDAEGRQGGPGAAAPKPVRRVNSTEGLLRQHAARAAEMAAAVAAAAAGAAGLHNSQGGRGGLSQPELSDDDHGSPRTVSPLPQPGPRHMAYGSAGSICETGGPGQVRRRDDLEASATSGPIAVTSVLQRWLSHGWRGASGSTLPRAHTATAGALAGAAAAAIGGAGGGGAAAQPSTSASVVVGHGQGRHSSGGVSIGGRLLWRRMHGGPTAHGVASLMRGTFSGATTGVIRAGGGGGGGSGGPRASHGGGSEGPASMPVVLLEDDVAAASGSANSAHGLNRISSLPTTSSGLVASGAVRRAALHRRGVGSEATCREGSLRHQNPLFLRNPSREGSRDERAEASPSNATPLRTNSASQLPKPSQLSGPIGGGGGGSGSGHYGAMPDAESSGASRYLPGGRGVAGSGTGHSSAPFSSSPVVGGGGVAGGSNSGSLEALRSNRRTLAGMPGPPRMSLATEAGLHPLLLNPMQPGGLAALPVHPLLGRLPPPRHPQQLGGRPAGPSPLGIAQSAALGSGTGTGMDNGGGTGSAAAHEPLTRTGDSITSAAGPITRGLTMGSAQRHVADTQAGSGDGGPGGLPGGPRGDSGSLLKAPSIGHPGVGPYGNLSYQHNATQGGYVLSDIMDVDALALAAAGGSTAALRPSDSAPLSQRLLFRLYRLWMDLLAAFRSMLRRCLRCVRLLTSSDDDAGDVDIWEHTDSAVLGGGPGGHKAAAQGSRLQETKGVLVDMGYYNFMSVDYNGQMPMGHPVHLMQIVPSSVAPRVLLFPWPLSLPAGWEKISPGFFDAPGSTRLLFPAMRELMGSDLQAMRPVVTVAFSSIEGVKELSAVSVEAARDVLHLHNAAVRETLSTCSGYECKEFNGSFMTTFSMPTSAVEWALTLQLALVAVPWPDELLACEHAAVVLNPESDTVLFRGLRCRVGIYAGPIDRVTPHPKTGRADYFGQPVNRAARLMTAAQGGQVVLDQSLLDDVLEEWRRRQEIRRLATIPSLDEGSPADDSSLRPLGEMRTARSFISKSINRLNRQPSVVAVPGTISGAASSAPSITNLPDISLQHMNSKGEVVTHSNATGTAAAAIAGATLTPLAASTAAEHHAAGSPFSNPGASILSKLLANVAPHDLTDGSISPHGSAPPPANTGGSNNNTAVVTAPGAGIAAGAGTNMAGSGGVTVTAIAVTPSTALLHSKTTSPARSLERILADQRVQLSARSEPRIPRISRFGLSLGSLRAVLRGGSNRPGATGCATTGFASGSLRSGLGQSGCPPMATHSSHSLNIITSSPSPWLPEANSVPSAAAQIRSVSFRDPPVGITPRSPPSAGQMPVRSGSGGGIGAASLGGAVSNPNIQMPSWLSQTSMVHTSLGGSMHSSVAGAVNVGGAEPPGPSAGFSLAPGLELQRAEWDPTTRGVPSNVRSRRRRRASIGAIVEGLLVISRKGCSVTTAPVPGVSQNGEGIPTTSQPRGSVIWTMARSPPSRASPAAAAARARLLPGSPHSAASNSSTVGGGCGNVSGGAAGSALGNAGGSAPMPLSPPGASPGGLHADLPDSPSTSIALGSPASTASSKLLQVRRMVSSPLGLAAHVPPLADMPSRAPQMQWDLAATAGVAAGPAAGASGQGVRACKAASTLHVSAGGGVRLGQSVPSRAHGFHAQQCRHDSFQHRDPGDASGPHQASVSQITGQRSALVAAASSVGGSRGRMLFGPAPESQESRPALSSLRRLGNEPQSVRPERRLHTFRSLNERERPPVLWAPPARHGGLLVAGSSGSNILSSVAAGFTPLSASTPNLASTPTRYIHPLHGAEGQPPTSPDMGSRDVWVEAGLLGTGLSSGGGGSLSEADEWRLHRLPGPNQGPGTDRGGAAVDAAMLLTYGGGVVVDHNSAHLLSSRGSVAGAPATAAGNAASPASTSVLSQRPCKASGNDSPGNDSSLGRLCPTSDGGVGPAPAIAGTGTGTGAGVAAPVASEGSSAQRCGGQAQDQQGRRDGGTNDGGGSGSLEDAAGGRGPHAAPAAPCAAATAGGSSQTSRTSTPSSSTSMRLDRETASRQPAPPGSLPLVSTTSSIWTQRTYDRSCSTAASGLLGDADVMPSFAANLLQTSGTDRPSNASGRVAARSDSGGGGDFSSLSGGPFEAKVEPVSSGRGGGATAAARFGSSPAAAPMLPRGFATLPDNAVYGTRGSANGEGPIVEEGTTTVTEAELLDEDTAPTSAASRSTRQPPAPRVPSRLPHTLSQPRLYPSSDANGSTLLGMPPLLGPLGWPLANGTMARVAGVRRLSDGLQQLPRTPRSGAGAAGQRLQASGSAGGSRPLGCHRFSLNSTGGAVHSTTVTESPVFSDVYGYSYGYGYGRSATNEDSVAQTGNQTPPGPQATHGSKHTSGSLYGSSAARVQSVVMTSADATALAAIIATAAGQPGASSSTTAASGGAALAADAGGPGGGGTHRLLAHGTAVLAASAASRRRASSGAAFGTSLRAAAELAISQMQHQSASGAQLPMTPGRVLRKSTSSRGRRPHGVGGGDTRTSATIPVSVEPGALGAVGRNCPAASGLPAGGRGSRGASVRPSRCGVNGSGGGQESSPSRALVLAPAVEQLAALVSQHGGLDLRTASPSGGQRASLSRAPMCRSDAVAARRSAPGHALLGPNATSAAFLGGSSYGAHPYGSGSTSLSGVASQMADGLRTPTCSPAAAAFVAAAGSSNGAVGTGGCGGLSRSGQLHQPQHHQYQHQHQRQHPRAPSGDVFGIPLPPLPAIAAATDGSANGGGTGGFGIGVGGDLARIRRSSAGGLQNHHHHHYYGNNSNAHARSPNYCPPPAYTQLSHPQLPSSLLTTSSPYSPHGTVESLHTFPSLPSIASAPGFLPRSHRASYSVVSAALAGTAPNTPNAANRLAMSRSSTPGLPAYATAPGGEVAPLASSLGGGATTAAAGAGPCTVQVGRLRASNLSLPDDMVCNTPQSGSRELSRPSDTAVVAANMQQAAPSRGSRWRSPRGGLASGEDGVGGGGAASVTNIVGIGTSPEKPGAAGTLVPEVTAAGGGGTGAGAGGAKTTEKDKENRPAVMAECYKITQQPTGGMGGGGNEVAQSITMIKYTNLKQELERPEEGEGDDVPVPTNMLLVPTVAVDVAIWSLGSFRLKGVTEPIKIVQVLPVELEGRLSILNKAGLNRGKARCIERRAACLDVITLQLPDVSRLACVSLDGGGGGTPGVSLDGGGGGFPGVGSGNQDGFGGGLSPGEPAATGAGVSASWATPGKPSSPDGVQAGLGGGGGAGGIGGGAAPGWSLGGGPGVLGQASSSLELARWAAMRSVPLREIDSSEAGLPPISEVVTPVSSPRLRSHDPVATPGALLAAAASAPIDGSDGWVPRRRSVLAPPPVVIPEGPTSPGGFNHSASGGSGIDVLAGGGALPTRPSRLAPTQERSSGSRKSAAAVPAAAAACGGFHGQAFSSPPYSAAQPPSDSVDRPSYNIPTFPVLSTRSDSLHGGQTPSVLPSSRSTAAAGPDSLERSPTQRRSSAAGGADGASAALGSTGPLPMSLSFMASRPRDPHSTYAAMIAAGMDVRSPGGSPVSTLTLPVGAFTTSPGATFPPSLGGESAADGLAGVVLRLGHQHGRPPSGGGGTASRPAPLGSHDRTSTTSTSRPLLIYRTSSGFNHTPSSSQTPGPALTDRSSSGRYNSAVMGPAFMAADLTSSGLEWCSSGRRTPSPLATAIAEQAPKTAAVRCITLAGGQQEQQQLPERASPSGWVLTPDGAAASAAADTSVGQAGGDPGLPSLSPRQEQGQGQGLQQRQLSLPLPHQKKHQRQLQQQEQQEQQRQQQQQQQQQPASVGSGLAASQGSPRYGAYGGGHPLLPGRPIGRRGPAAAEPTELLEEGSLGTELWSGGFHGSHGGIEGGPNIWPGGADGALPGSDEATLARTQAPGCHAPDHVPLDRDLFPTTALRTTLSSAPLQSDEGPEQLPLPPQQRPQPLQMVQQRRLGHVGGPPAKSATTTLASATLHAPASTVTQRQDTAASSMSAETDYGSGSGSASGGGDGGSVLASQDSGAPQAPPTFAGIAAAAQTSATGMDVYDITVSMRSSMAGSAVGTVGITAVESLRTFGLRHVTNSGAVEPVSASELLRPFAHGQQGTGETAGAGPAGAVAAAVAMRGSREGLTMGSSVAASGSQHWQRQESRFHSGSARHGPVS